VPVVIGLWIVLLSLENSGASPVRTFTDIDATSTTTTISVTRTTKNPDDQGKCNQGQPHCPMTSGDLSRRPKKQPVVEARRSRERAKRRWRSNVTAARRRSRVPHVRGMTRWYCTHAPVIVRGSCSRRDSRIAKMGQSVRVRLLRMTLEFVWIARAGGNGTAI
jgi:hypothetical protein